MPEINDPNVPIVEGGGLQPIITGLDPILVDPVPQSVVVAYSGTPGAPAPTLEFAYTYTEFKIDTSSGLPVEVDIADQTIDWAASGLPSSGTRTLQPNVIDTWNLVRKTYAPGGSTYLRLTYTLFVNGTPGYSGSMVMEVVH